jgi:hypothetical protein
VYVTLVKAKRKRKRGSMAKVTYFPEACIGVVLMSTLLSMKMSMKMFGVFMNLNRNISNNFQYNSNNFQTELNVRDEISTYSKPMVVPI